MISKILIALFIGIIIGALVNTHKHLNNAKHKNKNTNKNQEIDQDLQNLAYMDDLLTSQKEKNKKIKTENKSSNYCPFCNNPYYECKCSHSGENHEKISQRFIDD